MAERETYTLATTKGSFCVVLDAVDEDMTDNMISDRPWKMGNSPKTASWEFLKRILNEGRKSADGDLLQFEIYKAIENKLLVTVAPHGSLQGIG